MQRLRHEVVAVHPAEQWVEVRDLDSDELYRLDYDALILSPGATPVRPPLPGIERALSLRDIESARRTRRRELRKEINDRIPRAAIREEPRTERTAPKRVKLRTYEEDDT